MLWPRSGHLREVLPSNASSHFNHLSFAFHYLGLWKGVLGTSLNWNERHVNQEQSSSKFYAEVALILGYTTNARVYFSSPA